MLYLQFTELFSDALGKQGMPGKSASGRIAADIRTTTILKTTLSLFAFLLLAALSGFNADPLVSLAEFNVKR